MAEKARSPDLKIVESSNEKNSNKKQKSKSPTKSVHFSDGTSQAGGATKLKTGRNSHSANSLKRAGSSLSRQEKKMH